jgi:hypothetical protein
MIAHCPFCGSPPPHHDSDCRVPRELDRFERVLDRLSGEHRCDCLTDSLERFLVAFGRHPEHDMFGT